MATSIVNTQPVQAFNPNGSYTVNYTTENTIYSDCGLPSYAASQINKGYLVTISEKYNPVVGSTSTPTTTVRAFLQKEVRLQTGSHWESIGQMLGGDNIVEDLFDSSFQLAGLSSQSTTMSRRKWEGSDPVKIELELVFEAYDDAIREVIYPCAFLQALTLPRKGDVASNMSINLPYFGRVGLGGFFLVPPGPNPFRVGDQNQFGDIINIDIGGFLRFDSIVVEDVIVTYQNRMGISGPIGAKVNIVFTTYEILTRDALQKAYGNRVSITGGSVNPNYPGGGPSQSINSQFQAGLQGAGASSSMPSVGGTVGGVTTGATNLGITLGENIANSVIPPVIPNTTLPGSLSPSQFNLTALKIPTLGF